MTVTTVPRGVARSVLLFTVAQSVLIALMAFVLMRFVWVDTASARAIQASAWLAIVVQIVSFGIARLMAREQVLAGWGLGMLLRFAIVLFWAFLGIAALNLTVTPALMSLALFFFVSTLIEPIFLNI